MHFETELSIPYKWSTGDVYGRFLSAMGQRQLWGSRCAACDVVGVPPAASCRRCAGEAMQWLQLSAAGVLAAAVVVDEQYPGGPQAPFALGIIELDHGARLLHRVSLDAVEAVGEVVEAVWADEPEGTILDILEFRRSST